MKFHLFSKILGCLGTGHANSEYWAPCPGTGLDFLLSFGVIIQLLLKTFRGEYHIFIPTKSVLRCAIEKI